jgi:hypothetical protein
VFTRVAVIAERHEDGPFAASKQIPGQIASAAAAFADKLMSAAERRHGSTCFSPAIPEPMEVCVKRKTTLIWSTLAIALALAGSPLAQAEEPLFGTWKMNTPKSKYSPGPVPKSNIAKWEADDAGVKLTVDVVTVSGETQHY